MKKPNDYDLLKSAIKMHLVFSEENVLEDGVADLLSVKDGKKTAYFLAENAQKDVIDKATANIKNYDEVYLVFKNEKYYLQIKAKLPKQVGVILYGNLYGLGNIYLVAKKAEP